MTPICIGTVIAAGILFALWLLIAVQIRVKPYEDDEK